MGLFSIPQSDLVEPYLTVLDELSTLAGVSLADPVMPLVNTVKSALNLLVGAQNGTELQVGVLTTLSPLLPGDYCAIRAPRDFAFRRIATTCDDLLIQDGIRLAEMVNKGIDAAFGESVLTSAPGRIYEMPDLDRIPLYDV
ncbi:hypothetical protein [Kibdelosporangium aridum]|uniref:Uncharacterized protein n=1 Tax=Kibdelosporangium aridum TaxID=2030 RepID=A0A1W2AUM2_KIBAR|nr:hypothetical protein [Kibdelosporangium aridum]SMC64419.1 hypothetical protein SAMN05661093_01130 [Kibdelosporangium aridum]